MIDALIGGATKGNSMKMNFARKLSMSLLALTYALPGMLTSAETHASPRDASLCQPLQTSYGFISYQSTPFAAKLVFTPAAGTIQEVYLSTIGPGQKCLRLLSSEKGDYVFVEYENGAGGTSTLVTEKYLYVFSVAKEGLLLKHKEQLQERHVLDSNRTAIITQKNYNIKPASPKGTKPIIEIIPIDPAGTPSTLSY
jgi:hypothetical protein